MKIKKKSHIPVRTCIVCREKKAKSDLTRLVIDHDHQLTADRKENRKGRGAYICRNPICTEGLTLGKRLDGIFKTEVRSISQTLRIEG